MKIELNEPKKAWLACAIDTDGHVGMKRQKVKIKRGGRTYNYKYVLPILGFSNTHQGIVKRFSEIIESKYQKQKARETYIHEYYYSTVTSNAEKVKQLLTQIMPYLIVKRDRATYVLDFCEFKLSNPGDHSMKSNRRQEEDLKWLEVYKRQYKRRKRRRIERE